MKAPPKHQPMLALVIGLAISALIMFVLPVAYWRWLDWDPGARYSWMANALLFTWMTIAFWWLLKLWLVYGLCVHAPLFVFAHVILTPTVVPDRIEALGQDICRAISEKRISYRPSRQSFYGSFYLTDQQAKSYRDYESWAGECRHSSGWYGFHNWYGVNNDPYRADFFIKLQGGGVQPRCEMIYLKYNLLENLVGDLFVFNGWTRWGVVRLQNVISWGPCTKDHPAT